MAPLMIAGPKLVAREKQPFGARDRFGITDLILLYKAVTPEPRVVFKVLKERRFRAIRENASREREFEAPGALKRCEQTSGCAEIAQNAACLGSSVPIAEIPQTIPQSALISLDFGSNWLDADGTSGGAP